MNVISFLRVFNTINDCGGLRLIRIALAAKTKLMAETVTPNHHSGGLILSRSRSTQAYKTGNNSLFMGTKKTCVSRTTRRYKYIFVLHHQLNAQCPAMGATINYPNTHNSSISNIFLVSKSKTPPFSSGVFILTR